jgi:CubicO group peptidase (beta-lactamase class C family)
MAPDQVEAHEPGSYVALRQAFLRENPPMDPDFSDRAEVRAHYAAERPAIGAITNARALATMYAALMGPVDGIRLINDRTLSQVTQPRTDDVETLIESGTAGPDIRFGFGYQLASPSMPGFGPRSFGHTGAGGRLGIGDPEHEIGFGYITGRMRNIGPHGDPRWRTLIDAARNCV